MFTFIFARIFKRVLESLALVSSLSILGLEATCPWQHGPWPWTFSESLASKVVSSLPPLACRPQPSSNPRESSRTEKDLAIVLAMLCHHEKRLCHIACLLDQNKSGFFGGPFFFQPIRGF